MVNWEKKNAEFKSKFLNFLFKSRISPYISYIIRDLKNKFKEIPLSLDLTKQHHISIQFFGFTAPKSYGLWYSEDIVDKIIEPSFSKALYYLDQVNFSSFQFTGLDTENYVALEEKYPEELSDIHQKYIDGTWNIDGGNWTLFDPIFANGESIIRQRLIAQRFNARNFQNLSSVAWVHNFLYLPANLPQILLKTGANFLFLTNDVDYGRNKLPFVHFSWIGQDNSEILTSRGFSLPLKPSEITHFANSSRQLNQAAIKKKIIFDHTNNRAYIESNLSDQIIPNIAIAYGNHSKESGVLLKELIHTTIWEEKNLCRNTNPTKYFQTLDQSESVREKLIPLWKDNINFSSLDYSTSGIVPFRETLRTIQLLFYQTEFLSLLSGLLGREHFQEEITKDWEVFLSQQNISLHQEIIEIEIYKEVLKKQQSIIYHLASGQENALMNIIHSLREKTKMDYFTVLNSCGWPRDGYFFIPSKNFNQILTNNQQALTTQIVKFSSYNPNRETMFETKSMSNFDFFYDRKHLNQELETYNQIDKNNQINRFTQSEMHNISQKPTQIADLEEEMDHHPYIGYETLDKSRSSMLLAYIPNKSAIPAFGMRNFMFVHGSGGSEKFKKQNNLMHESESIIEIETPYFSLKVSKSTGIIEILKKTSDFELSKFPENLASKEQKLTKSNSKLKIYIEMTDLSKSKKNIEDLIYPITPSEVELLEMGPLRFTFTVKYHNSLQKSKFQARISYYYQDSKVLGEIFCDWYEKKYSLNMIIESQSSDISPEWICGEPFGEELWDLEEKFENLSDLKQKPIRTIPFQDYFYSDEIIFYAQNLRGFQIHPESPQRIVIPLISSKKFAKSNRNILEPVDDLLSEFQNSYSNFGFHRFSWALEFNFHKTSDIILKNAIEYNRPLLTCSSNALHSEISFFSLDTPSVVITSIKECEQFMREAPDWFYHASMGELPFIIRVMEISDIEHKVGNSVPCQLHINESITIKKAIEVDHLERIKHNGIQNSDVIWNEKTRTINFTIRPKEIKSILVIGKIPLENE
ncbi:MAG: hypothetical protein ACTSWL_05935 [Promethearchaeota archaeon]